MPIEVEGPDGSVVEFPDGTSSQVMQRAMSDKFGGPKNPAAPKPTTRPKRAAPVNNYDNLRSSDADRIYRESSAQLESQIANLPAEAQRRARIKFEQNPKIQALKGKATPRARGRRSQELVRKNIGGGTDIGNAMTAGAGRALFGIPERLAAAVVAPFSDKSYSEILEETRGAQDYDMEQSTTGNVIGQIMGSLVGGGAAAKGVGAVGKVLQKGANPGAVQAAGRAVEGLTRTVRGEGAKNLAKLTVAGAAGGGGQALGEGSDVSTGLTIGALAPGVLKGLGKVAGFVARPFADLAGLPNAGAILRRFTTATAQDMEAAAARHREATGAEPTLYEILPLADRNRLAKDIVGRTPQSSERAADAVRRRVRNVGPEMQGSVRSATGDQRRATINAMNADLAAARGTPANGVDPLAARATNSPIDMKDFQRAEAGAVMAPHEGTVVADRLNRVFPTSLQRNADTNEIEEVFSDPEVNAALTNAASSLRLRLSPDNEAADIAGLTAGDMTRILRQLAKVPPGTPQSGAAMRAEQVLMDYMGARHPEAAAAVEQMRDTFAARARMVEGMAEGGRTRTREAIPVETSQQARVVRNAYETPEGEAGRFLGQANAAEREFGGTANDALRNVGNVAESGQTQAALRQNLGFDAATDITGAAEAQARSVRNLGSLSKEKGDVADTLGVEDVGRMILALNPASMPTTKLFALSRLTSLTRLPERRARELVDMMFSQDPAMTNRAISLLNRAGPEGRSALNAIGRGVATGNLAGQAGNALGTEPGGMSPVSEASAQEPAPEDVGEPQDFGSYDEVLQNWQETEDPALVDLIERQMGQESGGQQFDENGQPLSSSAGAIGVMQVMPDTAPEAAKLAGLEWDENAYYHDPAYNKLLGIAYMKEMLRRFDGDVELALAAYNAGPGAVENAGGIPNIAETQDYVDKILAAR